jgi:hypothetical protein
VSEASPTYKQVLSNATILNNIGNPGYSPFKAFQNKQQSTGGFVFPTSTETQ